MKKKRLSDLPIERAFIKFSTAVVNSTDLNPEKNTNRKITPKKSFSTYVYSLLLRQLLIDSHLTDRVQENTESAVAQEVSMKTSSSSRYSEGL